MSTPASRSLPAVLRRLTAPGDGARVVVGEFTGDTPSDPRYASVELGGAELEVPKAPEEAAGAAAYMLAWPGRLLLLGAGGGGGEVGPPGPEGPQGPTGPQGVPGAQGPKGDTGATGSAGSAGADSTVPGPQGPTGATGSQGPKGDTGAAGTPGATGSQGPQGVKGDTGATGSQGPKGDTGSQGPQGPAGPAGAGAIAYTARVTSGANVALPADPGIALAGLTLTFTTPAYIVDADLEWAARTDAAAAAWYWVGSYVICAPAPVTQAQPKYATFAAVHSGGQVFFMHTGNDRLALAASTQYTVTVWAACQVGAGAVFVPSPSHLSVRLFPR